MPKLLIVDDDEAVRRFMRASLSPHHEIVDTAVPEEALALALEHKPDAILLDLRMPKYSGYELCHTLTTLSSTQLIPVIIVSGEAGDTTKQLCRKLGATAYFEKPLDVDHLVSFLNRMFSTRRTERRSEIRVRLNVALKLSPQQNALPVAPIELFTTTENLALSSFLCGCSADFEDGLIVGVNTVGPNGRFVGNARVVRSDGKPGPVVRYAFRFVTKNGGWVLQ